MGRPPKKPSEKKSRYLPLVTTEADYALLKKAADRDGKPISVWVLEAAKEKALKKPD